MRRKSTLRRFRYISFLWETLRKKRRWRRCDYCNNMRRQRRYTMLSSILHTYYTVFKDSHSFFIALACSFTYAPSAQIRHFICGTILPLYKYFLATLHNIFSNLTWRLTNFFQNISEIFFTAFFYKIWMNINLNSNSFIKWSFFEV